MRTGPSGDNALEIRAISKSVLRKQNPAISNYEVGAPRYKLLIIIHVLKS